MRVSVVVVNYQGLDDTLRCVDALREVDWPDLEVVVVDNGGADAAALRKVDGIRLVENPENTGFAGGCNLGATVATGELLAFLNNDAVPEEGWLREAVAGLGRGADCVASKVLSLDGSSVLYGGGGATFYGHGYQLSGRADEEHDVLFATGSAMVLRRSTFEAVGGFDERYFMFFEDVDLGWRLWLLGHRVRYVPASVVRHRHHGSMRSFGPWQEHYLLERNALATLYKNLDDENLGVFLPAAMALAARRATVRAGVDSEAYDLRRGVVPPEVTVPAEALVPTYAIDQFVAMLPSLAESRRALQAARRRSDADVFRLFEVPLESNAGDDEGFRAVVEGFGVSERFTARRRVVVATGEGVGPRMAGPAIRAWRIAEALSGEHEVVLLTLGAAEASDPRFRVVSASGAVVRSLARRADVVVAQGAVLDRWPELARSAVVVVDLYDPFHLEALEQARDRGEEYRRLAVREATAVLNAQLARGDFFLCASPKQRDFWLGQLAAVGRVNPLVYDADASLSSLLAIVPFGIDPEPPTPATTPVLRRTPEERVVLWGGGIYNWFDPVTLVEAMALVTLPDVRLHFLGGGHPNPDLPAQSAAVAARRRAEELGLLGKTVTFAGEWVPYAERGAHLLEAAVGVSTHLDHVETAYSFRTRILDSLWAGLPVVCTAGDALAGLVEREGLGETVPPGDAEALAGALERVLADPERYRANVPRVAAEMVWERALAPLVEFCRAPRRAPDAPRPDVAATTSVVVKPRPGWRTDLGIAVDHLREGGLSRVARKAASRLRHRFR